MISFDHVSYRYPFQDTDAVSDLTFNVSPGSVVLVTGVSGCGKTTLGKLIAGLYRPSGGRIEIVNNT